MIPAGDMDAYRAQVDVLAERASGAVRAYLAAELGGIDPTALDVAAVRDATIAALGNILDVYAVAGASTACDFMERHGMGPQTLADLDRSAIERAVRYQAGKLVEGDMDGFIGQLGNFARDAVRKAANEQQLRAAERSARRRGRGKSGGVRFARVPSGRETCAFCRMLASRGFVYWSRETAGEMDHFHRGCDCKIVASNDPEGMEGYDPDREYELWKKFEEIDADKSLSKAERERRKRSALNSDALASHGAPIPGLEKPRLVDGIRFDASSEDGVRSFFEMASREFDGLEVEHALVLMQDGSVYRAIGTEDAVSIEGVDLAGSCVAHNHPNGGADAPTFSTADYYALCQHQDIKALVVQADGRMQYMRPLKRLSESLYQEVMLSLPIPESDDKSIEELVWEEMSKRGYIDFGWEPL